MAKQSECDTGNLSLGIISIIMSRRCTKYSHMPSPRLRVTAYNVMILMASYIGMASTIPDLRSMRYTQPRRALLHLHIFSRTPPQTLLTRVAAVWGNIWGTVVAATLGKFN